MSGSLAILHSSARPDARELVSYLRGLLTDAHEVCDLLGLLDGRRGVAWNTLHGGVMIRCPWHGERTASCAVTRGPDGTLRVKCHGSCGRGGDVLSLVAAVFGLDPHREFREVLRETAHLARVPLELPRGWSPRPLPVRAEPAPARGPEPLEDELFARLAAALLEACPLGASPVAAYLEGRGLLAEARAAGWGALPASRQEREALAARLVGRFGRDAWLRSGLALRDGQYAGSVAHWEHLLLIPWRGPGGEVLTLQRRLVAPPRREREPKYVFPWGRQAKSLYGLEALARAPERAPVVLVEGAVDALAYHALRGRRELEVVVLGLPGIGGWRPEWAELARGREAVVAVDADPAGEAKAPAIARDLGAAGATRVVRARPRAAKDWAELVVERARRIAA